MSFPRLWRLAAAGRPLSRSIILAGWIAIAGSSSASAATLTGHVVDPDGRAVAGARVIATTPLGTAADRATDAAGGFAIDNIAAGRYDIHVLADGFQADPLAVVMAAGERRDVSIALHVSALAESIVVSAAQIDVPLTRAGDSVTVMTAADLKARQIETVADALRLVPGLTVTRSGGRGALTSLFPRGGESNYTLVLVDGMRANDFGGAFDFAHLTVADVDRVEIVRGPQSALFGSDAIGAVVQVVTRRGGRPRADALLEGGSQGTERAAFGAAGSRGAWTFGGGAEQTRSDGFTGLSSSGERVSNDDYHLWHASGTLGWQRPGGPDWLVSGNVGRDERGFPGPFGSDPIHAYPGVDRVSRGVDDTRQIGGRFSNPWSPRLRQRVEANYTDLAGEFNSGFGLSTSGTRRLGARVQEDFELSAAFAASAGVEYVREQGSSTYVTTDVGAPVPIDRGVTGTFGELRYVRGERLSVTGGTRIEHITRDAVGPNPGGFPPRPAFPDQTVNSVNPKIAASYLLAQPGAPRTARLHASAGTGIRPPDVFEIAFTDNPDLKPERSRSFDAGVEQQFAGGAYIVDATAFYNRYTDLLVTIGSALGGASQYHTDNISNARARGVELSGSAKPAAGLLLRASYTFLDTENLAVDGLAAVAPEPYEVGDPLIRRPRHQGAIDLTYAKGRVSTFGALTWRSQALDVEPNYGPLFGGVFFTPGYGVINAGVSVRIARGLEVYARGLNVADRNYEEELGFPALRRSGMVGVRVAASR